MVRGVQLFIPSNFLNDAHSRPMARVAEALRRFIDRIISAIRAIFCLQQPIELKRVRVGSQPMMPSPVHFQARAALPIALPPPPAPIGPQASAILPAQALAPLPPQPPIRPLAAVVLPPPPPPIRPLAAAALPPPPPQIRPLAAAALPAPLAKTPHAAPPKSLVAGGANAFCALVVNGQKADADLKAKERDRDPAIYDRAMARFGNAKPPGRKFPKQPPCDVKKLEQATWRNLDPVGTIQVSDQSVCGKDLTAPYQNGVQKRPPPKRKNHLLWSGTEEVKGNARYIAAALGVVRAQQGILIADALDQIVRDSILQMKGVAQTTILDMLKIPLHGMFDLDAGIEESVPTTKKYKAKMDELVEPLVLGAKSFFTGGVLITGKDDDLKVFGIIVGRSRKTRLKIYLLDVNGQIVLHEFRGPCIFKDYLYRLIRLSEMEGSEISLQYRPISLRN